MQELNTTTNKNPEVDLDTDDVQDTSVQLELEKEEKTSKPNLNLGEVDLGYQTYDKNDKEEKPEISIEEDKPEQVTKDSKPKDNLTQFSESVQKRINNLTKRMREAERREEAALTYAEGLKKKYSDVKSKYDEVDENYIKQYDARIDSERATVKSKLKAAIEMQDSEAIIAANEELARLTVEKERAKLTLADREKRKKVVSEQSEAQEESQPRQPQQSKQPVPSAKAKDWATRNEWFGQDQYMTNTAFQIHENLVGEGFDVDSEEYYNEIDRQIREVYPHKFVESDDSKEQPRKPVQTVATANRGKTGRRTVKLTKSQVAIAKKLGVPLEEYAKFVKEV